MHSDLLHNMTSWRWRRRAVFIAMSFCMATILLCLLGDVKESIGEIAVLSAFGLLGSTIGAYVFGAVWDDRNKMQHVQALGEAAPEVEEEDK